MQADDRNGFAKHAPQAQLDPPGSRAADSPAAQPASAAEAELANGGAWLGASKVLLCQIYSAPCQVHSHCALPGSAAGLPFWSWPGVMCTRRC